MALVCPACGAGEMHPTMANKVLIRGYKVSLDGGKTWDSQCLVCSGFYDKDLNETPKNHDGAKGWF